MTDLELKLSNLSDSDADRYLAQVWRAFENTEQHQALAAMLDRLSKVYDPFLTKIEATSDQRSFACGFTAGIKAVSTVVHQALTFQPPEPTDTKPFTVIDTEEDAAASAEDAGTVY